jgi:uncharacterized membrane protein
MRSRSALAAGLLIAAIALPAAATPSLTWLPRVVTGGPSPPYPSTGLQFLSPDGTLVIGYESFYWPDEVVVSHRVHWSAADGWAGAHHGFQFSDCSPCVRLVDLSATNVLAFNWDDTGGYLVDPTGSTTSFGATGLCPIPFETFYIRKLAANGAAAVGTHRSSTAPCGSVLWTETAGFSVITPPDTSADDVSDDGGAVAGHDDATPSSAFYWSDGTGYVELPVTLFQGLGFPPKAKISGDGATVVGTASTANGAEGFAWDAANGAAFFGDLPGGAFDSRVMDVSYDGSLVVGTATTATGREAFAWTRSGGLVGLGVPSRATAMTPEGLVVGTLLDSPEGDDVFVWDPATGWIRSVEAQLRDASVAVPADGLRSPTGISDDGRVVAGGSSASAFEDAPTWVATLDPPGLSCEVEMSQATYADGDAVVITSLRFVNNDTAPAPARLRLQITLPFGITVDALDLGAGGGFAVPAAYNRQLGPVTMFTLQPGQPRGAFSWRCAFEHPMTGAVLAEAIASFTFE